MKKVILFDKTALIIKDEQVPLIEAKLNGTAKFWLNHNSGRDLLDPRAIARITTAVAHIDYYPDDKIKRIDRPKPKPVDINSPGYQSYLKAKEKLLKKKSL